MPSVTLAVVVMISTTLLVLLVVWFYNNIMQPYDEQHMSCFRKCGVHNISHPFRLKDSPKECGDETSTYILSCEDNNQQLILYYESGKYYVQSINYNNFTIRLLDSNLHSNYSYPPAYSLGLFNFSSYPVKKIILSTHSLPYVFYVQYGNSPSMNILSKSMLHVRCPNRVDYSYGDVCVNNSSYYVYYVGGVHKKSLLELGLEDTCCIEFIYLTSWPSLEEGNNNNISCTDIHRMMFYGFELSWSNRLCKDGWDTELNQNNQTLCVPPDPSFFIEITSKLEALIIIVKFVLGAPCIIALLIYKWRRKHLSMFDDIEDFLRSDNNIMPIRYSYKDIKNITGQFKTKLGSGGYGSVFKGQLRSGRLVAVKLLDNPKSNGQDFINEVATIGRIHHVNVVQLIGFCVEWSKRALIYEFMPNGSLEKYIFTHTEESSSLSCEQLYAISLGVARGIDYLHTGCNMKILHFDIKPHNILLDENFTPKVSDFGLARLCPKDNSIVSLTAARGTIGYMAPELYYRNVGKISYKADVYSFGMLLMEMASRRKNLNALAEQSSQIYFPFWVYDQLHDGSEIMIENDTNQEMKLTKKMMIVALRCIQTKPGDRPTMDKVLEMLEEEDGDLQIPNKPYLYPQDRSIEEVRDDIINNSWTSSSTLVSDHLETT